MRIIKNIKFLRKKHGFTQETFANALGINRPSVGAYEEGRADPRLVTLNKMAELFSVSVDELMNEDLTNENRIVDQKVKVLTVTVDAENQSEGIQLVPYKVAAGYTNGYSDPEYISDLPRFSLPVLPKGGTYRAFEISGDSMLPIASGSIVIGKYVEKIGDIKSSKTYVVVTKNDGIVYKRVFDYIDQKGKLFLVSDNSIYKAYELDPNEVVELWEAKAFISLEFPDPQTANELTMEQMVSMIGSLRMDVENLKKSNS